MKRLIPAFLLILTLLAGGCGMSEEKKQSAYRKSPETVMWDKLAENSEDWTSSASRQAKAEKTKEENAKRSTSTSTNAGADESGESGN